MPALKARQHNSRELPYYCIFAGNNQYTARQSNLEIAMSMLGDLWSFLKERKKWWLLPVIIVLFFFGIIIVFASGSAIAPFIYTIF